jgi:hypothetical protein
MQNIDHASCFMACNYVTSRKTDTKRVLVCEKDPRENIGYTQKNGAVSLYSPLKPHHSFVYTLYLG